MDANRIGGSVCLTFLPHLLASRFSGAPLESQPPAHRAYAPAGGHREL